MIEKIYLLHAHAQSGKDTCANILKKEYEKKNKRVIIVAFADYVKFTLEKYFEINDFKSEAGRSLIQTYATDLVRKKDEDFWARILSNYLKIIEDEFEIAIIPDWRFTNEYEKLLDNFSKEKIIRILVYRPENNKTDCMTEQQRSHLSEIEMDNYSDYDYKIVNKTGELGTTYSQIRKIIMELEYD